MPTSRNHTQIRAFLCKPFHEPILHQGTQTVDLVQQQGSALRLPDPTRLTISEKSRFTKRARRRGQGGNHKRILCTWAVTVKPPGDILPVQPGRSIQKNRMAALLDQT